MAFDPTPTEFIAGWESDGTSVSFPIESIEGLTSSNVDPEAYYANFMYYFTQHLKAWLNSLTDEEKSKRLIHKYQTTETLAMLAPDALNPTSLTYHPTAYRKIKRTEHFEITTSFGGLAEPLI